MDRNSTSFARELTRYFTEHQYDPNQPLKFSQFVPVEYLRASLRGEIVNGGRGLIVNHQMGVGKTIAAVELADILQREGFETLVIGPRTLEQNFADNVKKLAALRGAPVLPGGYTFFTLRANNLPTQIMREHLLGAESTADIELPENANLAATFEGKVVIVDEAHLLCNSIAHGRRVALQIYRALMAAKRVYVFLLTGTLVTNTPFEAVPAFNLVAGRAVFEENQALFIEYFGTPEAIARNRSRLQNLVSGYLSYAAADKSDDSYPTRLPTKVMYLPMDGAQLSGYYEARQAEVHEGRAAGKRGPARSPNFNLGFVSEDVASSYKVRTRIASNGMNKLREIADIVAAHPRDLILVSNPFVERGGIRDVAAWLRDTLDYAELVLDRDGRVMAGPPELIGREFTPTPDAAKVSWRDFEDGRLRDPVVSKRYYFVLSGETRAEQFEAMLKIVCDPLNRHGAFIHVMLTSSVGNLGLDLKNGRVVVCESLGYHIQDFNQLVSRYDRWGASVCLPPDQRTIQPYILVSTVPDEVEAGVEGAEATRKKVSSTDEELLYISLQKLKANTAFMTAIRAVSIECLAGVSASPELCRSCLPTGRALTTGNFSYDMQLPNPCQRPRVRVRVDDEERDFEYEAATDRVRVFDAELGVELTAQDPLWKAIVAAVEEKTSSD